MRKKFAAQLYTLRNELQKDFPGVLRKLKKMGWAAVQIDGLHGYSAEEIGKVITETGLKTAGMHVSLDRMTNELDIVIHEARLLGTKDLFCHYLEEELQNVDGYKRVKKELLEVARNTPADFRIGYHNHDFEFHTIVENKVALEYILEPTGNEFIYPEIDTYWVKKAGRDPLEFIKKYANRMPILHLKDMTTDGKEYFSEIGTGSIDFEPILKWGEENSVEWYAVEQDYCSGSPLDSLELSLKNLLLLAEKVNSN
ncbi:sugar phosphate isomerase/epimerase [Sporosarcina sp. Marseille-Q4063]|uniref:sugar phosphate isomerase/epimerase family protein n=1 Tax=Sporosarcina sp. Marseille-Q4063 TaxID=2810514 RepID=UPI001BAFDD1C|nr:sugar phosphate isomerase/epimerase [Sporosarcina sp. Marseille-Q4063]QUW21515.1 sugar phosphate isomerase/epimerase [Sporosarcina sp. Marseille-Q4063]